MAKEVELLSLDLRYQSYRLRDSVRERQLLSSILEREIEEPLEGIFVDGTNVLLNGFKRYRCAKKLNIQIVPYISLGDDEVEGIVNLLKESNSKSLNVLEEARFVSELKNVRKMNIAEIATELLRSKSWVSMRANLIGEMSEPIRKELFDGKFPAYSYMYLIRQFMRMNGVKREQIETFVTSVSGHKLSIREIEQLAHGYFRGPTSFKQEIENGNIPAAIKAIEDSVADDKVCSEFERTMLRSMKLVQKHMLQVISQSTDSRLKSRAFHAQSHLLTAGIIRHLPTMNNILRDLHDRNGQM